MKHQNTALKFYSGLVVILLLIASGCKEGGATSATLEGSHPDDSNGAYDVDVKGIPKFVRFDYIELAKIHQISKFRSAIGHEYSDAFETGRSMKHYFLPFEGDPGQNQAALWSSIKISAPLSGTITKNFIEWAGTQLQIRSIEYPAFYINIFHINLAHSFSLGDTIAAGQLLGTHIGDQTMSDIAVGVNTPGGWKLLSYFDVMTDSVFKAYQARGMVTRSSAIIPREARDADSLTLNGDAFTTPGHLENWIILN